MGFYTNVMLNEKEIVQVKCFESSGYQVGDSVEPINGEVTYSIALREGGFLNIDNLILVDRTDKPRFKRVFDKWGSDFNEKTEGIMPGEPYLY